MSDPHRDLREQLEAIAEDLGDRALACLREALEAQADAPEAAEEADGTAADEEGATAGARPARGRRPPRRPVHPAADEERRLTRARRAVEKAAALLEAVPRSTDDA
jgi:hypothetical protein